jgi:hypothetical protein
MGSFPAEKRPAREIDHSDLYNLECEEIYFHTPYMSSPRGGLVQENLVFLRSSIQYIPYIIQRSNLSWRAVLMWYIRRRFKKSKGNKGNIGIFSFFDWQHCWSRCSSRFDGNMLRVRFSCSPFVPSEHGVKMTAPIEDCIKDKQHAIIRFLVSKGMKGAEIHRQLAAKYGENCLPQWSVCEWITMFKNSRTSVIDADR